MKKAGLYVLFSLLLIFVICSAAEGCSFKPGKTLKNSIVPNEYYFENNHMRKTHSVIQAAKHESQTDKITQNKFKDGIYYKGKAVVLTYHHISREPFSGITIKPERFENDLEMLKNRGFNVISMGKLLNCMEGREKLPDNAVVISFDDGIESFYRYAYPLLKKYNMPSINFVITSRTENYKPSNKDFNPLSPEEILEMYSSGLVDIQSHSDNGHDYVYINPELKKGGKLAYKIYNPKTASYETDSQYSDRVTKDLLKSRDVIFKYTGQYPNMLCFPFGHYNKRFVSLAKNCGFQYFVTTQYGYNKYDSESKFIYRIRSGDSKLNSEKLFNNILNCANNVKAK